MPASSPRMVAAICIPLCLLLGACSSPLTPPPTPHLDSAFGEAVRQARAMQTIDPDAGRKGGPVAGIDGEAGRSVMQEYQKSFTEPPRTFNILGIGGQSMSSSP